MTEVESIVDKSKKNEFFQDSDLEELLGNKTLKFFDSSLSSDVNELSSNKNLSYSDMQYLITNIALKYFHGFITPQDVNKVVSLEEIGNSLKIFSIEGKSGGSLRWCNYQLRMLGDFPKTCKLFEDIAMRNLDQNFSDNLVGIDAGSGSGILLLAQAILAKRHKLEDRVMHFGLEHAEFPANRTNEVFENLNLTGYFKVLNRSSTILDSYLDLAKKGNLFFFSNENITSSKTLMKCEPYFENQDRVQEAFGISNFTDLSLEELFFPRGIRVSLEIEDLANKFIEILNPLDFNEYFKHFQKDLEDAVEVETLSDNPNFKNVILNSFAKTVYPRELKLGNYYTSLSEVGMAYEDFFKFTMPKRW